MRKILFVVLLLQAAAAFAQPSISNEIFADVTPRLLGSSSPAVAMAKDRHGIAIAWTMSDSFAVDHVYFARLDATGHFTGSLHNLGVLSSEPSLAVAPGGEGFVLAFVEKTGGPVAAYCMLDRDLNSSSPVVLTPGGALLTSPPIVRSGKTTWIAADTLVWQIQADGSLRGPLNGGINATDMTVATDVPQLVSGHNETPTQTCRSDLNCTVGGGPFRGYCYESCRIVNYTFALQFTALYTASSAKVFPYATQNNPAVGSDGHDVLVAWFESAVSGGSVVATRVTPEAFANFANAADHRSVLGSFLPGSFPLRADIASDGARYVVVWHALFPLRGNHIAGAAIDRSGNITPFSFETQDDERYPSVIATGPGSFLVAYEMMTGSGRRIAGRFVTFPTRTRAVR
jgi:hypothetical protein